MKIQMRREGIEDSNRILEILRGRELSAAGVIYYLRSDGYHHSWRSIERYLRLMHKEGLLDKRRGKRPDIPDMGYTWQGRENLRPIVNYYKIKE